MNKKSFIVWIVLIVTTVIMFVLKTFAVIEINWFFVFLPVALPIMLYALIIVSAIILNIFFMDNEGE